MSMLPVQLCLDLEPMVVALVQARFDLQVEEPMVVETAASDVCGPQQARERRRCMQGARTLQSNGNVFPFVGEK